MAEEEALADIWLWLLTDAMMFGNGNHIMDTSIWIKALALFLDYPVLFIVVGLAAVAAFVLGWRLCKAVHKGRVEALEERLRLATEQYNAVNLQLADVNKRVATQEATIAEMRQSLSPPARVEQLMRSNTEIREALISLATSTSTLGHTLTLSDGRFQISVRPYPSVTPRST
jgi:hypothetical protein